MLSKLSELRPSPSQRMHRAAIFMGLVLFSTGQGQAEIDPYHSLAGLKGVRVAVLGGHPVLEENGLPEARLTELVTIRLGLAGIPVSLDRDAPLLILDMGADTGSALALLPVLDHLQIEVFWYARISVRQEVLLSRDRRIHSFSETWYKDARGRVRPSKVPWLTDEVEKLVDKFVIDYLRANQRQKRPH